MMHPAGCEPLVVIGSSPGGPAALVKLFEALPADFPAAFVVVQHLEAQFAAGMASWLDDRAPFAVRVAREGDLLAPGLALLAGSSDHLTLTAGRQLGYTPHPLDDPYRPSVDVLFRSVATRWHGCVIGVLLTGMGRDGALGLKMLRDRGHHTIAQDQESSAVYGMPKAAAALEAAVDILSLDRIAPRLIELVCGAHDFARPGDRHE